MSHNEFRDGFGQGVGSKSSRPLDELSNGFTYRDEGVDMEIILDVR